jgi:hypothetical protein
MEPTTGVEPVNLFLTKEALYRLSYVGSLLTLVCFLRAAGRLISVTAANLRFGAGDEIRTRDIQLGRLKLYQLSYSRTFYADHCLIKNHY